MSTPELVQLEMATPEGKREAYRLLKEQTAALCCEQRLWFTNLAQFSALAFHTVPTLNWVGFYMAQGDKLVLGPFQGKVACTPIPFARGVCGACARTKITQIVSDVEAFPGHIACDSESKSEIVLPLLFDGRLVAVLDVDSPVIARFDIADADGLAQSLDVLVRATDWESLRVELNTWS